MADEENMHKRIRVTAIVHVIEARHLVGKYSNHLSDPFVRVTVAGKRQTTEVRRNQINATWDQVFVFQDLDLSIEEYESELIVLQAFDANLFVRNELIGQFSFGLSKVRNQPPPFRHQVFQRWVVLTNPEEPLEEQGYLRVSVTVLGPGDTPPSHERQDDFYGASGNKEAEERILRNPDVRRRGYNFSVKVFRGEDLPVTDVWNKTSDPFVVVRFNGIVCRTPHQRHTTTPNWNHLLVLPVYTPCFADTIEIQLYDFVRGQPDRLLATSRLKFTNLLGESFPPSWLNFYGRTDENNESSGWIFDMIRATKTDIDTTAFMGRVLLSLNTTLTDTPMHVDRPCAPIKGPKTETYELRVDVYRASELPVSAIGGSAMVEVQFGPEVNKRESDWCAPGVQLANDILESDVYRDQRNSIRFTCSGTNLSSVAPQLDQGGVTGLCQFSTIEVALPQMNRMVASEQQASQLYDIIINVYVKGFMGGATRVGFLRIKPMDVWGFNNPPEWHPIRGIVDAKGNSKTPGQLLVSVSFGTAETARKFPRQPMGTEAGKEYQLRAHIYQARNLRPTAKAGLASTHVCVTLGGRTARLAATSAASKLQSVLEANEKLGIKGNPVSNQASEDEAKAIFDKLGEEMMRTSIVPDSLNPVWFETLVIDRVQLPEPLSLAPDIDISVLDDENLSSGDVVGRVKFPAVLSTLDLWPVKKRPRWLKMAHGELSGLRAKVQNQSHFSVLQRQHERMQANTIEQDSHAGDILVKLELIPVQDVAKFPLWSHKWPRIIPSMLRLGTVGLRRLEEYGIFGSIDKPFMTVSVQSLPNMLGPVAVATNALKKRVGVSEDDEGNPTTRSSVSGVSIGSSGASGGGGGRGGIVASQAIAASPRLSHGGESLGGFDASFPGQGRGADSTSVEDISLAVQQTNWMFARVPFLNDLDAREGLSHRWLQFSSTIESVISRLLTLNASPGDGEPQANLFFPESAPLGFASWSNEATLSRKTPDDGRDRTREAKDDKSSNGMRTSVEGVENDDNAENRSMPSNNQLDGDTSDDISTIEMDPELGMGNELEDDPVMVERKRRTFFERISLDVNMPVDPFYAPSMTVKVMDSRTFGVEVIATASINTRELASAFLYTDAMKQRAREREGVYEVPRFAMASDANDKLRGRAEEESDDDDDDIFLTENVSNSQPVTTSTPRQRHASSEEDSEDQTMQEEALQQQQQHQVQSRRNGGREDGENAVQEPSATAFDDTMFDDPAEGHFDLPLTIVTDMDEVNHMYDESQDDMILEATGLARGSDFADLEERGNAPGETAWPAEQESVREANQRLNMLEDFPGMKPLPFYSFDLFRGSRVSGDRIVAGVFKSSADVNPVRPEMNKLHRAIEDFKPPSNDRGEVLVSRTVDLPVDPADPTPQGDASNNARSNTKRYSVPYMAVSVGDVIHVEEEIKTQRFVIGQRVAYRPDDEKSVVIQEGVVPTHVLDLLHHNPFKALDLSPDCRMIAADERLPEIDPNTDHSTNAKSVIPRQIPPISETVRAPQQVKVRVYIVACSQLAARSLVGGSSDPYVVVKLNVPQHLKKIYQGNTAHNDRANYKTSTLDPFFGQWYELDASFPDICELEIEIWNANFLNDDLIGATKIDLEDRWFNMQWHELKFERKKIKEYRTLKLPGSDLSQGLVEMWIEMYKPEEYVNAPIVDIRAPKTEEWELRLVIWETRRVPLLDDHHYGNLYVTGEVSYSGVNGSANFERELSTDVHTGLKDGRGIFNFRMLFPMEAPSRFPRLRIKVWERWLISYTALGEANVDLSALMREASRTQEDVIDRKRGWVTLTHSNWPGSTRGDIDIQMSLVRKKYAEAHPVGKARDPPNENPFLPDPPRESIFAQVFRSVGTGRSICCIVCCLVTLVIIIIILWQVLIPN
ncbi:Myoferlin (Fer-1-like protein 3) [Durusdinium trenchii]|uniref:Myoferlin (Fer-1-like protein 3) n=1 Tax=Durusdinium trenchii TaxID=1381693 RepID=A0ABP0H6U3_9DINO